MDVSAELLPRRATRARTGIKWMRIKRPLKDLLGKIMIELRRKDEYALFDEPVNPDNFPGYLEAVGGEDKMMDLGTMQSKIDDGLYKTIDELQSDLQLLAAAATSFNPPGTIPHTSANRLLAHGLKHIERARPIILTPSPSPDRRGTSEVGTPWRNGREATAATDEGQAISSVPPQSYIPEEMLLYPPNSAQALAVGWNLTGGKRVYAKRLIRGREKFYGKWRHWSEDGSRDLAELEEPTELLREWQASRDLRRVVDWKGLRKDGAWWEFELGGPAGQPPIAFTPFPRPDALRTRPLGTFEWGVYPEIEAEIAVLRSRNPEPIDEYGILERHLSTKARPPPPKNLVDIYDEDVAKTSGDYVRTMCAGDLQGEAYIRSVNAFVRGAMESSQKTGVGNGDGNDHRMPLDEYVSRYHRGGVLLHPSIAASDEAMAKLQRRPLDPAVDSIASRTYAATALHQLTDASNPLDIVPFLREPKDFNHAGVAGKSGVQTALDGTAAEIVRLAEEIQAERDKAIKVKPVQNGLNDSLEIKKVELEVASRESSPLSAAPDSPKHTVVESKPIKIEDKKPSREEAMTKLRLELVALTKFYPLAALKRMTPAEAEKLLPMNVRHLMCRPPKV
ncbi:hypothetical protein BCR39DRAFT_464762 [Naematelia encephala]|uniref:Bromo domain-containing protein n=1 Tax=Naematelia encephala TaxID=71784 RepID=A0A1Y2BCW2_9TREE|nr:hypothetical protein BCR39DRAFT_464762 [Naematelia encephala]